MIKTLRNLFKQDKEKFVVPKSVQAVIPIKTNCSAVIPLYFTKPIIAKGEAPKIHTQLRVSVPKCGRSRKNRPTATPQARAEKMNCLSDSPKNILSV